MSAPILLTLYGEDQTEDGLTLGQWEEIAAAAIANVVGDVVAVSKGTETVQTAIFNTFVPFIGKWVGKIIERKRGFNAPAPATQQPITKLSQLPENVQRNTALIGTGVPFAGMLIYQGFKGTTFQ